MPIRRETILVLEDASARIERFERVTLASLPAVRMLIANTATEMFRMIDKHLDQAFAISLDHDLYVPGITDAGDGLQVAEYLADDPQHAPSSSIRVTAIKVNACKACLKHRVGKYA